MAEIEWKGATWKAAYGSLSVKELLTILKGFGPMEILEFEKPGRFHGQMSLSLSSNGRKQITLYYLEAHGEKRRGKGREALEWLRGIFKGELYVEDPGVIHVKNPAAESLLFWIAVYREGLIEAMESESFSLQVGMSREELQEIERKVLERG